jgi:hypothetical protein
MQIPETLYGEIVFDRHGYVIGMLWRPEGAVAPGCTFRAKVISSGQTTLLPTRQEAIDWIEEKSK